MVDKSTRLFVILADLLVKLIEQSIKQKVVDPNIHTVQMYNYVLMITICRQKEFLGLRLEY